MGKKTTTLEDLARMVAAGFEKTATKQELAQLRGEMRERFEGVENRLDALDLKVHDILKRLVENHEARIGRLEAKLLK